MRNTYCAKIIISLFNFLFSISCAYAYYKDGNDLYKYCNDDQLQSILYIEGVADGFIVSGSIDDICLPNRLKAGQLHDVVCLYLKNNPSTRDLPAALLSYRAMLKAWPCNAKR